MELLGLENREIIEASIKAYGSNAEHNYHYFVNEATEDSKPVFAFFGQNKGMLLIDYGEGNWQLLMDPLAPENERTLLIKTFLEEVKPKSFQVETTLVLRKELLKVFKNSNIKVGDIRERYITPIIYLDEWDPEMKGADLSDERKSKGRFFRNHKIEILKPGEADIKELKDMVIEWKKRRKSKDIAHYQEYISFFKQGFPGADASIILRIDDKVRGVAAGWMVPNTERIYFAINLHDYSMGELGDFLTVLFLNELKAKGFKYLDFGSSDVKLLAYKKKFRPKEFIETAHYYIAVK